jgi:hypothetical protein
MRVAPRQLVFVFFAVLCAGLSGGVAAQTTPAASQQATDPFPPASPAFVAWETTPPSQLAADSSAVELLRSFNDADIKFDVRDLMEILRDRRHEGWVLAAYPDPKTGHPLIGAGFTLDLPARAHSQSDALNPHPFLEPSSADLWRAAGLDPGRLQSILDQYSGRFSMWKKKRFRQKIRSLAPQITDDEATLLLRIAAIQAIYNAKAYCRNFDQMSASQQMALSQLVYQMGVNLARFDEFLSLLNDGKPAQVADASLESPAASELDYWRSVQHSLMQSQWAKLYRTRAIAVIAMLDPAYADSPAAAEHFVNATLRPAVAHRRRGRSASLNQVASSAGNSKSTAHRKRARTRAKRRA